MESFVPFDLPRMFLGDDPPLILAELAVRVVIIWLWTIVLLRWVGGRSVSQMSVVEFLLVIALGSAVGDGMYMPEVPLFHAMLVILLVIIADKSLDYSMRRWSKVKAVVDGIPVEVIRDGQILHAGIVSRNIGEMELMEALRISGIRNLGVVDVAYMEPSGKLSIFRAEVPRPGLCIVPPVELCKPEPPANGDTPCCLRCGRVGTPTGPQCDICGHQEWTRAVTDRDGSSDPAKTVAAS